MKPITKISSIVLALVALAHLARVILDIHIEVYSVSRWVGLLKIPMWVSILGFVLASILSIGLWRESK